VPALGPAEDTVAGVEAAAVDAAVVAAADADAGGAAAVVEAAPEAAAGVFLLLEHAARSGLVNARVVAPKPAARKKFRRLMAA
jgi:predicted GTPase